MARAKKSGESWDEMLERLMPTAKDWPAMRRETSENITQFQGNRGERGRNAVQIRQMDWWAVLDTITLKSAQARLAISIARELSDRLDALEGRISKAPPGAVYRGVFKSALRYSAGDLCTHAGSLWHCNSVTSARPGEGAAWTLAVKRGRADSIHTKGSDHDNEVQRR